ncbi:GDSL esterase/lipase [Hordeum vulgare]|nr:GDSL esterase/lipase [Hordeum vulgare]
MKLLPAALGLVLVLLLVLNPNGVEARPAPTDGHQKKQSSNTFFVFGDDFADNGNLPLTDPVTEMSRQWAYPYGSGYVDADGFPRPNTPSGRFSNYKIQSDFIVALVAFSGNDYASTGVIGLSNPNDINAYIGKVTKEIAANVEQLQKIGVKKVKAQSYPAVQTQDVTMLREFRLERLLRTARRIAVRTSLQCV